MASTALAISKGSARRPGPNSASAMAPSLGPTTRTPSLFRVARFRRVAGCRHMRTFIAGAIRIGRVVARRTVEARSEASPLAIRAIRFAVAGATTMASASRASLMWPISASSARSNRVGMGALSGQGGSGEGGHEFLCPRREQRTHPRPALAEAADQVQRLVGGDTAADDEQDASVLEGEGHDGGLLPLFVIVHSERIWHGSHEQRCPRHPVHPALTGTPSPARLPRWPRAPPWTRAPGDAPCGRCFPAPCGRRFRSRRDARESGAGAGRDRAGR